MRHITSHLVKTLDVGANQNLFGGRMLEWLDEAGVIYTRLLCPGFFVTLKISEVIFHHPIKEQTVIDFYVDDLIAGKSSLTFKVIVKAQQLQVVSAGITFVNIGADNKKQYFNWFDFETEGFKKAVYNRVKKYYSTDARKYHNIFRLDNILGQLNRAYAENLIASVEEYKELYMAIGYHDAVYTPGAADNEDVAAELLNADFGYCQGTPFQIHLERVSALIRSTRVGFPETERAKITNADLLHDFDYMVFADYKKMVTYNQQISFEYLDENPTEEQRERFKAGRRGFLISLTQKSIFLSPRFASLNSTAQENLKKFIAEDP